MRSHIVFQHPEDIFKNYLFGKVNSQKCKFNFMILQTNSAIVSTNFIGIMIQVHYIDNQFNLNFQQNSLHVRSSCVHYTLPSTVLCRHIILQKSHIRKTMLYFKGRKFHICDMNDMVMPKKIGTKCCRERAPHCATTHAMFHKNPYSKC